MGRQPYLQRLLAQSVSILWTTAQQGSGSVIVTDPNGVAFTVSGAVRSFLPSETGLAATYYQYQADVAGLREGTSYSYAVAVDGQIVAYGPSQYSFTTPAPGKFSFLAFGDSGDGSPQQLALTQQMLVEPGLAKVIHLGDLAYESGTFAQFEANYFALYAPLMSRLPFFATPGNHEYLTDNAAAFMAGSSAPVGNVPVPAADLGRYYSFDWGDAHFVAIDSNLLPTAAETRMLAWLDADLAATGKYWKIVFLHHPPYPTGTHLADPICAQVQQSVNPIVEAHGVQLVLSGHEHGYERSWPLAGGQPVNSGPSTTYVISGGGGMVLEDVGSLPQCALSVAAFNYLRVDIDGSQLSFSAIGLGGNVIDTVTLNPPPVVAANGVLSIGDFTPAVAAGSLASIFGQNLAIRSSSSSAFPLPTQLGGVTVTANGLPVPLLYVSPTQLNVQIPYAVAGQVTIRVATANGSISTVIPVMPVAPSILAVTAQNAVCSATNPALPSGYVTVYATGLGPADSSVATGQAAPFSANSVAAPVQVWLDEAALQPSYAGMAPGFAGLNQINFKIPAGCTPGSHQLRISAGPASSQPASLIVGSATGAAETDKPVTGAGVASQARNLVPPAEALGIFAARR